MGKKFAVRVNPKVTKMNKYPRHRGHRVVRLVGGRQRRDRRARVRDLNDFECKTNFKMLKSPITIRHFLYAF